jgi:hypothetical protein
MAAHLDNCKENNQTPVILLGRVSKLSVAIGIMLEQCREEKINKRCECSRVDFKKGLN